ncbi:GNAT family N-acetyltransferase, partial [Psychrobacter sp. 1U2]
MTNITLNAIPPNSSIYNLDEQFMVHLANKQDLPEILAIYNQSIAGKQATANLTPVTCEERAEWFDEHLNSPTRPIYVVRAAVISADDDKIVTQTKSPIVAW